MKDPRFKVAKKVFLLSWVFYTLYIACSLAFSYLLGNQPLLFGLPLWVAAGCVGVPVVFVVALIAVAEKAIPDISLTDEEQGR